MVVGLSTIRIMAKPKLFIFVGYPGAGKTSVAKLIEQRTGATHLWADHIRRQMFNEPTHSRTESAQLYRDLNDQTGKLLAAGKSVIFDTNFNFYYDRELLRNIASDNGAKTVLIWVTTKRELARQRAVVTPLTRNGYDAPIPELDFDRMTGNLQPPKPAEKAIMIDGTNLDADAVYEALDI
jgi:predicted kinase